MKLRSLQPMAFQPFTAPTPNALKHHGTTCFKKTDPSTPLGNRAYTKPVGGSGIRVSVPKHFKATKKE